MKLLALFVSLVTACAPPDAGFVMAGAKGPTTQPDNYSEVWQAEMAIMQYMYDQYEWGDNTPDVRWKSCGQENGFYSPDLNVIWLCTEFMAHPKVAVFVAAHEMGHAVTWQLLDVLDEESADEVAALALLANGQGDVVLEAALYFQALKGEGKGGGHPAHQFRAWNLACLAAGADGHPAKCESLYEATRYRWARRLAKYMKSE